MTDEESTAAGFYPAAWLIVAKGGWWKVAEIIDLIPLAIETYDANVMLWCMAHRHNFLVTRGRFRTREYAVTRTCGVPRGVSAGDAVQALTGRAMREIPLRREA